MKVLQVNNYHYLRGGAERVFLNTMELLSSHEHEVIPFCTRYHKNLPSEFDKYFADAPEIREQSFGGKIKAIPRFFRNSDAARKLDKLLTDTKPDIAHLHNIFNGLSMSILPVFAKHGVPVVWTLHDCRMACPTPDWMKYGQKCENCRKSLFLNCIRHRCYDNNASISLFSMLEMIHKDFLFNYDKYISRYIFLSREYQRIISMHRPYFNSKGLILHNFTPIPDIEENTGDYLLYFGRVTKEKGVKTILEAAGKMPSVKIKIAGTGDMTEHIQQHAPSNVEALGFLNGEPLTKAVGEAKAVLVPSESMDNNPMSIIEANMLARPAIGTRIGGIPEIIVPGKTGWLIDVGDADALASCMEEAWNMPEAEYAAMRESCREFAMENFSPESHYKRLMEIYEAAIASSKK